MKNIFSLILFFTSIANAQQYEKIDLRWKINDTLTYETIMKDVFVKQNVSESETDSIFEEMDSFFKDIQKQRANLKYETKLFPDKNYDIDIVMLMLIKQNPTDTTANLFSEIAKMNENVVLRGKVSQEGELLSFYYKRSQNTLISILFELPTKPIKIGEKWTLNINLISMDQNFVADTLSKKNEVYIERIIDKNGQKVAIIRYDIAEFVSGDFGNGLMSMFSGKTDNGIFMDVTYKATGLFSVDKGMWIEYDGIMEIKSNISMMGLGGNKRTEFKLIPIKPSR